MICARGKLFLCQHIWPSLPQCRPICSRVTIRHLPSDECQSHVVLTMQCRPTGWFPVEVSRLSRATAECFAICLWSLWHTLFAHCRSATARGTLLYITLSADTAYVWRSYHRRRGSSAVVVLAVDQDAKVPSHQESAAFSCRAGTYILGGQGRLPSFLRSPNELTESSAFKFDRLK